MVTLTNIQIDLITSCFDIFFIVAVVLDIKQLCKDKEVLGIDYRTRYLYIVWGIWSTFFVYAEHLHIAKALNVVWTICTIVWLVLFLRFRRQALQEESQSHILELNP